MKISNLLALVITTLTATTALASTTTYSRDHKYIYIKTPLALTLDRGQTEAIKAATAQIAAQLDAINAQNPRLSKIQKLEDKLIRNADAFENSIDQVIDFSQKYYGSAQNYGMHFYSALPTGIVIFGGMEVSANMIMGAGGSVMTGVVIVPQRVQVIEIDTNRMISDSVTVDTSLIVFPGANVGVGVGGGVNLRVGMGFIFGQLEKASDFKGLLAGASASYAFGIGNNFKVQVLKNWSKPGAVSNIFVSAAYENGIVEKAELHANLSYIVDAQAFFNGVTGTIEGIGNKLGISPQSQPINQ